MVLILLSAANVGGFKERYGRAVKLTLGRQT
jgi:hypothetical protein